MALGVNFVLLTGGVDLSIGSIMYLAAVVVGLSLPGRPVWLWPLTAVMIGATLGLTNGVLVTRGHIPPFIATLALAFVVRGAGLWLSATQMVIADPPVADLGRPGSMLLSGPVMLSAIGFACCWLILRVTPFGLFVRAIGANREGARRAGIPDRSVLVGVMLSLVGCAPGFTAYSSSKSGSFGLMRILPPIMCRVASG